MNALREMVTELKFAYDNSGLKAYLTDIRGAAQNVERSVNRGAAAPLKAANEQINNVRNSLFSLRNMVMGYVGMAIGGSVAKVADNWASVSGRVKLATKSAEEHLYALEQIYAIAQRTNQEYTATGDLFQKVQRNAKDLGLGVDDTLNLTEIIGQTMSIGGGDAGAQQAALMQLGQALGAGALRGDELNSIIEQAPRLAQAIADSFGVGVGQLKDMGKAGKLTSKELSQGLLKQADKIKAEFEQMPKTFGQGMTLLKNTFGRVIDFAVNKVSKLGATFYKAAQWVEKNIRLVLMLALSAIGSKLVLALKAANGQLLLMMKRTALAMLPFLKIAAVLAGIFLIAEDIYGWTQGWETVTGDLVGSYDQWAYKFRIIKDNALILWASIQGLFDDVGKLIGIDISDWLPNFSSWGEFASASLQWIIDGVNNLIKGLRSLVKMVRLALRGDFAGALDEAGNGVDLLSMKFLPFYAVVFGVVKKIGKLFKWLGGSAIMGVATVIGKTIGYSIRIIGFLLNPIFAVGKGCFKLAKWFSATFGFAAKVIGVVLKWGGKLSLFLGGKLLSTLFAVGKGFVTVGRMIAVAFATNPIGLLITVIAAAVALIIYYWDDIKVAAGKAWDWISQKSSEIWENIKNAGKDAWQLIEGSIRTVGDNISKIWNGIINFFKNGWNKAIEFVTSAFSSLIPDWVKNLFGGGATVTINGEVKYDNLNNTIGAIGNLSLTPPSANNHTGNKTVNNHFEQHFTVNEAKNAKDITFKAGKEMKHSLSDYRLASQEYGG